MNQHQTNTFELLLILGVVLLLVSPVGKWLGNLVEEITTSHKVDLSFNPFSTTTTMGVNQPVSHTGNNALVGHYTVNLAGGGQMTVNANSADAAVKNVIAQGGTPA